MDALQRAAGGGIAAERNGREWTSKGEPNGRSQVREPERILRYQDRRMLVRAKWVRENAPSRVAPQEL